MALRSLTVYSGMKRAVAGMNVTTSGADATRDADMGHGAARGRGAPTARLNGAMEIGAATLLGREYVMGGRAGDGLECDGTGASGLGDGAAS